MDLARLTTTEVSQVKTFENHALLMITSVVCAVGPSVTTSSTDFFLPKPGFLEFI